MPKNRIRTRWDCETFALLMAMAAFIGHSYPYRDALPDDARRMYDDMVIRFDAMVKGR